MSLIGWIAVGVGAYALFFGLVWACCQAAQERDE
jgi:hypothetical protein